MPADAQRFGQRFDRRFDQRFDADGAPLHEVVIVGGGPVGAALALALRSSGFDVALIERAATAPVYEPAEYDLRVYAIAPQSAEWLQTLGVWPQIVAQRASAYAAMRVFEHDPEHGLSFTAADVYRSELGWIVEHSLLVERLWHALPTDLPRYQPASIQALQNENTGYALQLSDGRVLRARLLVAADGADSPLRALAGIDTVGWSYRQRALIAHLQTERPHRGTAWQRFLRSGPLALLPLADGRSSLVWSADEPVAQELLALDDAAFLQRLFVASRGVLGSYTGVTRRLAFPLRLGHAVDYFVPHLVLVGDAAHAMHPLAGQGVNHGLADAACLSAALVAARQRGQDWAGPRVLARYARARKAANLEMLALTEAFYRLGATPLPGLRAFLGFGLEAVEHWPLVKRSLAQRAVARS